MTKMESILLLDGKVPIRLIQEPYCEKCMNPLNLVNGKCDDCLNFPLDCEEWYFNRIIALGLYKTYSKSPPYNKIPFNILSRLVLRLKGQFEIQKKYAGSLLADGLFKLVKKFPFLINDTSYVFIPPKNPPKNDLVEENQCQYILDPFIRKLKKDGFSIDDLSHFLRRKEYREKNRGKNRIERFLNMKDVHICEKNDLNGVKCLIIDDVVTTKSTIWDVSRALKECNAGEINILCVGRSLNVNTDIEKFIPNDLDFNELLTFFSSADVYREAKNIDKVKINDINYNGNNDQIECDVGDYEIFIDFENYCLGHNCDDFKRRRYSYKSFCKHLTKLFIKIKEDYGEKHSRDLLNIIYTNLSHWKFEIFS